MGTYNTLIAFEDEHPDRVAAFAKAAKRAGVVAKIGKADEPGVQPMEVSGSTFGDPDRARKKIQKLTHEHKMEAVLVMAQSSVDAFLFVHWNSGKVMRVLALMDYVWEEAEGEPQEWEAPAFKGA